MIDSVEDSKTNLVSQADILAFRGVIDVVPHPIFVKDDQTRFVVVNELFCELMGHPFEELVGKTDYDFFPKEQADVFRGNDLRVLNTGEANENEELFGGEAEKIRTIITRKKRVVMSDGSRLLVGCITDISDFRRAEALVRHLADHDALTGLPNRRRLTEKIQEAVASPNLSKASYSILLIDLDRFKPVNDVYGHTVGDAVLCEIASRLESVIRAGDTVARLGGDEFAVICTADHALENQKEAASNLASRIIAKISVPIDIGEDSFNVGASVGIALFPEHGTDQDELLKSADIAMYKAKHDGRGRFHFFEKTMDAEVRSQASLEGDLRRALASREIQPHYQPLMELSKGKLVGFEILARWQHATLGNIAPDTFIPIAEKLGLISALTRDLLRTACNDAKAWPDDLVLALNLSPLQLTDAMLPLQILAVLNETEFPPSRLEIEVTEGALVKDLLGAKTILTSFQNLGVKISLDDFGMGYSSMYNLADLRFDKIKIDRSFIQSMSGNPESLAIVNAVLALSKRLGVPTLAEGVENKEAMLRLIDGGCEFGQGYLFGKAVSAAETREIIEQTRGRGIDGGKHAAA
jgi:diguanylate cyclase (GGDEF)-like protein/PAS domain S-box-containing protein